MQTALRVAPDMTRAATTAPELLPAQAPTMRTPRVDQALVMSQSVMPALVPHSVSVQRDWFPATSPLGLLRLKSDLHPTQLAGCQLPWAEVGEVPEARGRQGLTGHTGAVAVDDAEDGRHDVHHQAVVPATPWGSVAPREDVVWPAGQMCPWPCRLRQDAVRRHLHKSTCPLLLPAWHQVPARCRQVCLQVLQLLGLDQLAWSRRDRF